MTAPQIKYVHGKDGTRIAVATAGEGQPLVFIHNTYLTIEGYWEIPAAVDNIARLAKTRQVVLFDQRGAGLSALDAMDYSLEALVQDLSAVVDSLRSTNVDLLSSGPVAPVVITYAAKHAGNVRKLVMDSPYARNRDMVTDERRRIINLLADVDWEFYLRCLALSNYGWTEVGRRIAEKQGKEADPAAWQAAWRASLRYDASALLTEVRCRALVLERTAPPSRSGLPASASATREVAAGIPGARLARFDPDQTTILASTWDSALGLITDFLDEEEGMAGHSAPVSGTAVILFTDIVDSTGLTERLGDASFRQKARGLDEAIRKAIRQSGGTAVEGKTLGDGVLAVFGSAREAIACARSCHDAAAEMSLALHAGIHAGDVIREDDNVFGGAVNIAARVAAASASGETLVSDTVRSLARTSAGVSFEDRGAQAMKGIEEPVRVFAVRWQE